MYFLHTLVIAVTVFGAASTAQQSSYAPSGMQDDSLPLTLALEYEEGDIQLERETASFQFPAATPEYREDQRCMTICSNWGEECLLLDTDAGAERCVRTCTSFSEECL